MSKVTYHITLDKSKNSDSEIIDYIKAYSSDYYMSQTSVMKMIFKIAIIDMNILKLDVRCNQKTTIASSATSISDLSDDNHNTASDLDKKIQNSILSIF